LEAKDAGGGVTMELADGGCVARCCECGAVARVDGGATLCQPTRGLRRASGA